MNKDQGDQKVSRFPLAALTVGRSVTVFADQLLELLVLWFVWELTKSSTMMAIATFAGRAPFWLFAFYGATLVDRIGPFYLLKMCNLVASCIAFLVASKLFFFGADLMSLVLLTFFLNTSRSLEAAALTSAAPIIVADGLYQVANSWFDNSKRFGRLTAPLLARWLAVLSPGIFVAIASISYLGMSLIAIKLLATFDDGSRKTRVAAPFSAAFVFVKHSRPLAWIFGASAVYAFFHGAFYFVVLPRISFDLDPGSPSTLGILITLFGVGGIISNLVIARVIIRKYLAAVGIGMVIAGLCFTLLSMEPSISARMLLALLAGAALPLQDVFVTCSIQTLGPANIVARLHATWRLACEATISIGILLSGILVDSTSASLVGLISGGAIILVGALLFFQQRDGEFD